jgi:hypothetical protein
MYCYADPSGAASLDYRIGKIVYERIRSFTCAYVGVYWKWRKGSMY